MATLKPTGLPPLAKYIAGKRASEAAKAKKTHAPERVNAPPPADVEGGPLSETDWARAGIKRGDGESKATTVKGMWGLERQLDAIPDASAEKLVAVLPDRSLGVEIYASAPVALLYQIVTLITLPLFVLYLLLKAIMGIFLWMANGVVYYCCCGRPSFAEVKPGDGWCLITGASYGIGNSIAREMASRGYDVILVARTTSKLTECAEQCRAFGVQAKVVTQDLALENSPEQLWKKVQEMGLDVSILVNNAGAGFYGIFNEVNWGKYSYMINLNMRTYAGNIHHFGRPMIEKGRGHILNIASIASFAPAPSEAMYNSSKAFVLALGQAIKYELRNTGVSLTTGCPGFTQTRFWPHDGALAPAGATACMLQSSDGCARQLVDAMFQSTVWTIAGTPLGWIVNYVATQSTPMLPWDYGMWFVAKLFKSEVTEKSWIQGWLYYHKPAGGWP
mmetsp:Transcript_44576/g.140394  ORF Transcript_44576/g.140394 Transcript_44576/m.140394 type:complete len:447 (-) Transcript_44576:281-1621(-)